jgi:hypothetical protein
MAVMVLEDEKEGISFEPLTSDVCVVITHRNHPLLEKPNATLREVLSYPLLSPDGHIALRRAVQEQAERRGLELRLAPEARRVSNCDDTSGDGSGRYGSLHSSELSYSSRTASDHRCCSLKRLQDSEIVRNRYVARTSAWRRREGFSRLFEGIRQSAQNMGRVDLRSHHSPADGGDNIVGRIDC